MHFHPSITEVIHKRLASSFKGCIILITALYVTPKSSIMVGLTDEEMNCEMDNV